MHVGDSERRLLLNGLEAVGVSADEAAVGRVLRHLELVAEWNEKINLTAIKDAPGMIIKHAVDSAVLLGVADVPTGATVADVGTGAGFPGITLKCLRPDIRLVLVDSLQKRCKFLEAACTELFGGGALSTGSVRVVWGRAEEVGVKPEFREKADVVCARAVADLRILAEYCMPLVRVGGQFWAMKGPDVTLEVSGASLAIRTLGGELGQVASVELPGGAGGRSLIQVRKVSHTPKQFPRKAGTPEKSPL